MVERTKQFTMEFSIFIPLEGVVHVSDNIPYEKIVQAGLNENGKEILINLDLAKPIEILTIDGIHITAVRTK